MQKNEWNKNKIGEKLQSYDNIICISYSIQNKDVESKLLPRSDYNLTQEYSLWTVTRLDQFSRNTIWVFTLNSRLQALFIKALLYSMHLQYLETKFCMNLQL
jgi:hypothetical protein